MSFWEAALWGSFGGLMIEGLQFYYAIRHTGKWPWRIEGEPGLLPLFTSVIIRVGVSVGLAGAAVSTGQISGPAGAIAVGTAAPLLIEQLIKRIPPVEDEIDNRKTDSRLDRKEP